ncbi:peptidoglycan-binding domain-containing protein [Terrabacter carboxydivorans]|uniref:Peptidoglycan hydrolase-like protein with peptidoglycan-binding domain n=1 Tax=Terrabacter carboxydivorans TaxID=619730 RepID=A0ABP5YXY6_9MICO
MALRRRPLGLVLALPALTVPMAAQPAAAVQAPPTRTLPSGLDVYVPYQGQTVCDPVARPGVLAFARLMTSHYGMGSTGLIGRTCGSGPSEHYDGRAWDWMLNVANPSQEAVAQSVLAWLTAPDKNGVKGAMARRFGIMYIIHNRKMWRSYAPDRGWAPYYGSSPHTDHIHFSFNYDGAAGRTSWWTGVPTKTYLTSLPPAASSLPTTPPSTPTTPTTPLPSTPAVLSPGMRSEAVRQLQVRLGNLPTTGYFGDQTKARVVAYQAFVGLARTGTADLRTQEILASRGWRSVTAAYPTLRTGMTSAAVRTLQVKLGSLPTTGYYGSLTQARVTAYQKFVGLPQTGVADPVTQARLWVRGWTGAAAAPAASPAPAAPTYPTLRFGMTSAAVKTLQAKLGSLPTTGYYGTMTRARVTAYQKFAGLPQTGVADSRTQQVLLSRGWSGTGTASTVALRSLPALDSLDTTTLPTRPAALTVTTADLRTTTTGRGPAMTTYASTSSRSTAGVASVEVGTSYTPYKSLTLATGSRGAAVRVLQRALGGLAVDGVFGTVTRDKVVSLQRSLAQPQTGVVTPELWDVLEARDFPFVADRSTVLRAGDTGPQVVAVQRLLGVRQTGVFDLATREAVKAAQARAGLASTGVVASRTWSLFDRLSA